MSDLVTINSTYLLLWSSSHLRTGPLKVFKIKFSTKSVIVNSEPTRVACTSESMIHVWIVDNESPVVSAGTLGFGFSDHLICYSVFNWKSIPPPLKTYVVSCFSPSQLQSDLDAVPWSLLEVFDDLDDKLTVFNLLLKDVVDKCAPLVKKKQRKCVSYGLPMIFVGK